MTLAPCHSRVSLNGSDREFTCTHPRVHSQRNEVSAGVCRVCQYGQSPAPDRFRALCGSDQPLRRRDGMQIVVAHYRESLDWLESFRDRDLVIYEKSPEHPQALPNVGREAHTYLHHILENYDRLADVTVFLQGDPRDHASDIVEQIWSVHHDVGFRSLCKHILIEDDHGDPVQPTLALRSFYETLFQQPSPSHFVCHSAACFAVSRANVLAHPKSFYERAMRLLLASQMGPWEVERLWQFIFANPRPTEGIVTASDAAFFKNLQFLLRTLTQHTTRPICVFDLGLTAAQREWCRSLVNVQLRRPPRIYAPVEKLKREHWWQTWFKPYFVYDAPFDHLLWLDADCFVLRDIDDLFTQLADGPLIFTDTADVEVANDPRLYARLPIAGPIVPETRINAGVIGLSRQRDYRVLAASCYAVMWAAMNPAQRNWVAWADQGALLWAVQALGLQDRVRDNAVWNFPMQGRESLVQRTLAERRSLKELLCAELPDVRITHWLGADKLAGIVERELERILLGVL